MQIPPTGSHSERQVLLELSGEANERAYDLAEGSPARQPLLAISAELEAAVFETTPDAVLLREEFGEAEHALEGALREAEAACMPVLFHKEDPMNAEDRITRAARLREAADRVAQVCESTNALVGRTEKAKLARRQESESWWTRVVVSAQGAAFRTARGLAVGVVRRLPAGGQLFAYNLALAVEREAER